MSEHDTRLNDGEDLEIAHAEDFGISRNGDGELQGVKQRIPGTDRAVLVKPMAGGQFEEWKDVLEEDEADDDRVDEFFQTFIEEGIGSGGYDEVPEYVAPGLIQAVKNGSGHEVFRAVQEQQTRENLAAMEALDGIGDEAVSDLLGQAMDQAMDDRDEDETKDET
ncbi:hypothetical protein [Natronorubrum halophilum]|uniref:hypothetical protein n=1 Tax=Natronorubrum halophilum TaxID=1702106 RepID=UPI0010C1EF67|nr:hypothetical protein [Natronorubrum halophilum]